MTRRLMTAALALAACSAGCGQIKSQGPPEPSSKGMDKGTQDVRQGVQQVARGAQAASEQVAQGLQQVARGIQQIAQNTAKPVEFELLTARLPELAGWTRSPVRGEQVSFPVPRSRATAIYQRNDSRIEIELTDSALNQLVLAPFGMFLATGYSERSDDGFKRAAKIGGYPGYEEWSTRSRRGKITAVVNSRFIVEATGHDVSELDVVRKAVLAVDLAKLGTLK